MIRIGSKWWSVDQRFIVIGVIEQQGHTWVHYRNEKTGQEYSCYEESFRHRFIEVLNEH